MMGWLFINLSVLAKTIQSATLSHSMILYQMFCLIYILDYFFYEEYMTSTSSFVLRSEDFGSSLFLNRRERKGQGNQRKQDF
ncbi:hypothetical protein OIU85_000678 [Salix viminalis]|uniref:Uncharacterized protein n=1 Tax=Salix viminalis TaxID=40686 RepID=A0A9Q0ZX96_SALVM|nr:hypothetical protein OIU85_000678 [Salix viminalis]